MTAANLDQADLRAVVKDGVISESVLRAVWDVSAVPLPLTDLIGSDSVGNHYTSWLTDKLLPPDLTNAAIDGADAGIDESVTGLRVGNFTQIPTKSIKVSTGARESDTIAYADELANQVERRQQEVKRDTEQRLLSLQGSIEDTGTVAGECAGLEAWLETNTFRGATGADGGFGTTTPGIVDAAVIGTARPLTETLLKDAMQAVYEAGGEVSVLMCRAPVKRLISEYFYSDQAKTALTRADVGQDMLSDIAKGNIEMWVSDFGTVALMPNRMQAVTELDTSTVFLIDPNFLRIGYLWNMRVDEVAKLGLADNRLMSQSFTLKVLNEEAHALVADINETAAMVA